MLNNIGAQNSKKFNCGLKICILKILSEKCVSSTHTATLESDGISFRKWLIWKKENTNLGLKLGSGSKLNLKFLWNY